MQLAHLPIMLLLFMISCAPSSSQTSAGPGPTPGTRAATPSAPLPAHLVVYA